MCSVSSNLSHYLFLFIGCLPIITVLYVIGWIYLHRPKTGKRELQPYLFRE